MWPQLLPLLGVFLVNDLNALDIAHLNSLFGLRLLAHVVNTVARAVLERFGHFAIISKSHVLEAKEPLVGAPAVVGELLELVYKRLRYKPNSRIVIFNGFDYLV
jgi:hypothetical protein